MIEFAALLFFGIRTPGDQIVIRRFVQNLINPFGHGRIRIAESLASRITGQRVESVL